MVCDTSNASTHGNVYVLCSADPPGADPLDVRFSRSSDGGVTWSPSIRINDDPVDSNTWQWFGTMSIAPNGRIDVVWNDTRHSPSNYFVSELYYSSSSDGGVTWTPNEQLSPAWDSSVGWPQQDKIGDYYHMISDNVGANLAYAATFNGEQDVWFLRIGDYDCNGNGIPDTQDIANGTSNDCNGSGNGIPDECEADCNDDGIADSCQLVNNDCNNDGIPDDCEPGHEDCNNNGIFDQCENYVDCNNNGRLDSCDIANGTSQDCNGNGIPNECELPATAVAADVCSNAAFITPGPTYYGQTTFATTTDAGSGASCGVSGRDVYYRYRPVVSGTLSLSLCVNTGFDTVMSVHTGCPGSTANQITGACNDDGCGTGGGPSVIYNVAVTAGTTYLIRIAGYNTGGAGGGYGAFGLVLSGPTGFGDCNHNGIPDSCDIATHHSRDTNRNQIPDECEDFTKAITAND